MKITKAKLIWISGVTLATFAFITLFLGWRAGELHNQSVSLGWIEMHRRTNGTVIFCDFSPLICLFDLASSAFVAFVVVNLCFKFKRREENGTEHGAAGDAGNQRT